MAPRAVYIHIPFCTHKCHYCDFTAYAAEGQPIDEYLSALEMEMELLVREVPVDNIDTIFIGGGTPSILTPMQFERLCQAIIRYFPYDAQKVEFTVEANPESTTHERLVAMKEGGVNRISFGAQTFRPDLLKQIGRVHGVQEIERSVHEARKVGIYNLSLDLMVGLPRQTIQDIKHTLDQVIQLAPTHLSCYSLKVEEGTLFHHWDQQGKLPLPTEDEEFEMYQLTRETLQPAGYVQYEISNFAFKGYESRHNSVYWRNEEYFGLGVGAHGYIHHQRYANIKGIQPYINRLHQGQRPVAEEHLLPVSEEMENFMILGLRLMRGIEKQRFQTRYKQSLHHAFGSTLKQLKEKGLLAEDSERWFLTNQGLLFGNEVFASFLRDSH